MAKDDLNSRKLRCSFCNRTQDQVDRLIAGNGAYICSDCVRLCVNIVDEELPKTTAQPAARAEIAASRRVMSSPRLKARR